MLDVLPVDPEVLDVLPVDLEEPDVLPESAERLEVPVDDDDEDVEEPEGSKFARAGVLVLDIEDWDEERDVDEVALTKQVN